MSITIRAYYDGSAHYQNGIQQSITLAGYAASPAVWAEFDKAWQKVLQGDRSRPAARFLHMVDLHTGNGQFALQNGWTRDHRRALLNDATECLNEIGGRERLAFVGATCTVPRGDYARVLATNPNLKKKEPEAICVDHVTEIALRLLPQEPTEGAGLLGKEGTVEFFFDRGERYFHKIHRIWNRPYDRRPGALKLVSAMTVGDKEMHPGLQAADYLAWLTNRHLSTGDVQMGLRRIFTAPMFAWDHNYETLFERYHDWDGDIFPRKNRQPARQEA